MRNLLASSQRARSAPVFALHRGCRRGRRVARQRARRVRRSDRRSGQRGGDLCVDVRFAIHIVKDLLDNAH
jgi:hypothetical protein